MVTAMSGIKQVVEAMRVACGVAEAAIAEAISIRSQLENRVASLVARIEETTLCAISHMARQAKETTLCIIGAVAQ